MAPPDTPLDLVIRFSTSTPDITLLIAEPARTSALSLKQQIRARVEAPVAESRLRLIHAGKVLQDGAALSGSVTVARPPRGPRDDGNRSEKAKGKQPIRDPSKTESVAATIAAAAPAARIYIHCSVGDLLTPSELAEERRAAQDADHALLSNAPSPAPPGASAAAGDDTTTITPAPRGFDRLLTAGFTTSEVAQLRTQFLAIQAHTHTPDTMPSGPELLALEERWLDSGSDPTAAAGDTGGFTSDDSGGLEDMLCGNLIGFFWPIGALWLLREEGVWTRRRQISVLAGFLVNVTFGVLRTLT